MVFSGSVVYCSPCDLGAKDHETSLIVGLGVMKGYSNYRDNNNSTHQPPTPPPPLPPRDRCMCPTRDGGHWWVLHSSMSCMYILRSSSTLSMKRSPIVVGFSGRTFGSASDVRSEGSASSQPQVVLACCRSTLLLSYYTMRLIWTHAQVYHHFIYVNNVSFQTWSTAVIGKFGH